MDILAQGNLAKALRGLGLVGSRRGCGSSGSVATCALLVANLAAIVCYGAQGNETSWSRHGWTRISRQTKKSGSASDCCSAHGYRAQTNDGDILKSIA